MNSKWYMEYDVRPCECGIKISALAWEAECDISYVVYVSHLPTIGM